MEERLEKFLFDGRGIESIFKNITWITGAAAIFKLAGVVIKENTAVGLVTAAVSILLFSLAITYGMRKIIIPFLVALYGQNEKYYELERSGAKFRLVFSSQFIMQFFIYLLLALLYSCLAWEWFDIIVRATTK